MTLEYTVQSSLIQWYLTKGQTHPKSTIFGNRDIMRGMSENQKLILRLVDEMVKRAIRKTIHARFVDWNVMKREDFVFAEKWLMEERAELDNHGVKFTFEDNEQTLFVYRDNENGEEFDCITFSKQGVAALAA